MLWPRTGLPTRARTGLLVFVTFCVLAVVMYLPTVTGGIGSHLQGQGDISIFVWNLRWAAYALTHGQNLLHTNWLNYPAGLNVLDNTSVLLLGVLATPVTLAFGAIVSFNILQMLAFATSAMGAYLLLRRWTAWVPAAFIGGLLYGFSPYMVSSNWDHLHCTFNVLAPLMILCLAEIIVRRDSPAARWGIAAGVLAAAQFFISDEMLAEFSELTFIALIVLALLHRDRVKGHLRHAAVGIASAVATATVLLAYPVWYALRGPGHGALVAPFGILALYSSDLLGPVVPTSNQLLTTHGLAATGDRLSGGAINFGANAGSHLVTNGTYLGLPLLVIVAWLLFRRPPDGRMRFFLIMTAVAFVAALGPELKVDGHLTGVPLPERLLLHLPLLQASFPFRYGLFVVLGTAILLSLGLDRLYRDDQRALRPALLGALALIPLIPAASYSSVSARAPRFFTSAAVHRLATGSVVLSYPPPTPATAQTMTWQALAGLRYRMVGAYMNGVDGHGRISPTPNQSLTETLLYDIWAGQPTPALTPALRAEIRTQLRGWHVSSVIVALSEPHAGAAMRLFTRLLGAPPHVTGGVALWSGR